MKKLTRPIPQPIQFTKDGYLQLETDLQRFIERRKEAVVKLRTAREGGDLKENGAYKAARFELSFVDGEIRRLNYLLRYGVVPKADNSGIIDFGCTVTLDDGTKKITYMLVNKFEANPKEQKISVQSPLGKALLGKKVGEKVVISVPAGEITYTIVDCKS